MKDTRKVRVLVSCMSLVLTGVVLVSAVYLHQSSERAKQTELNMTRSDAEKFASEYTAVSKDNRYVYATNEQILEVFESGSGIVYLGFPECPWCQKLTPLINTAAKEEQLTMIYYFNIRTARAENDDTYQKIVDYLKEYLKTDEEGNPRISVPDVTALRGGTIVGRFKQEPSSTGEATPDTYWTTERQERAVTQLRELIKETRA